ncbi:MAG TPA: nuclear transport factor 2 family protein, partial [Chitinophagaceae bacterium]|nr:nuclear transport factor 2 family protein [Chitinophagaceae bacterium]
MKLTKKLEAEILKAYNDVWEAYLRGDIKTFASILDENCYIIGSAAGEVFNNKKAAVKYYKSTAAQITGKAEFRNRKIKVRPVEKGFMVNEEADFYLLIDDQWTFYGPGRISSLFHKKNNKWKVIHQHGSFPDAKTDEGEQVNTDKIKAENIQLRDAVKRRTEELENKNRELESEAALERVRAKTMAMQKPSEFVDVINVIGEQFVRLGFDIEWANFSANGLDIFKGIDIWNFVVISGMYQAADRLYIPYIDHPLFTIASEGIDNYRRAGKDFFVINLDKKDKDSWMDHMFSTSNFKDLPDEVKIFQYGKPGYTTSVIVLKDSWLSIGKFDAKPFTEEQNAILRRFANAFGQAYTRFLDLQKAEAQTREAEIQLALERVRARSLAMHHTSELQDVVDIVAQQLHNIDMDINGGVFLTINDEVDEDLPLWASSGAADYVQKVVVPFFDRPIFTHLRDAIKRGNNFFTEEYSKKEKDEMFHHLFRYAPWSSSPEERKEELLSCEGGLARSAAISQRTSIAVTNHNGKKFSDEDHGILKRFGNVFEQSYTRFLDLQKAEAQAREAQIQLALERVRARTMAMQHSDELKDAAALLFQQVKSLGVPAYSCGYNIWEKNEKEFTSWMSTQDGRDFNGVPNIPLTEDANFIRYVESKQNGEQFFVLELRGERMQEHYEYLKTIPAFKAYFDYAQSVGFDLPETQ